jgi:hypothetical protein
MYEGNENSLQNMSRIDWYVGISNDISIPHKESQEVDTIQLIREN